MVERRLTSARYGDCRCPASGWRVSRRHVIVAAYHRSADCYWNGESHNHLIIFAAGSSDTVFNTCCRRQQIDIEVARSAVTLTRDSTCRIRRRRQASHCAWVGYRQRTAVLPHIIDVGCSTPGRVVVGAENVAQAVGAQSRPGRSLTTNGRTKRMFRHC